MPDELDGRLRPGLDELRASGFEEEADAVQGFLERMADDVGYQRLRWYLTHLRGLVRLMKDAFLQPTRDDVRRCVRALKARVEKGDLTPEGEANFYISLKRFAKWHRGNDEAYPPEVAWVSTTVKGGRRKEPEDRYTEEEMTLLIQHADHPEDRGLVALMADTGCSIDEALSVSCGDLTQEDDGTWKVYIPPGKHLDRRVPLLLYGPHIVAWRDAYREEADPGLGDPLLPRLTTRGGRVARPVQPLSASAARARLQRIAARADLGKRVTWKNFRDSRASLLAARGMSEAQLEKWMGWIPGGGRAADYVRLNGVELEDAARRAYELPVPKVEVSRREARECGWCEAQNGPFQVLCSGCGSPLVEAKEVQRIRAGMREQFMAEFRSLEEVPLDVVARQVNEALERLLPEAVREESRRYVEEYRRIQEESLPDVREFMAKVRELDRKFEELEK